MTARVYAPWRYRASFAEGKIHVICKECLKYASIAGINRYVRTTVTIDDDLLASAADFSGIDEKSKLLNFVLDAYVKRMTARRLAALGGSMPDLEIAPRDARVSYFSDASTAGYKVAEGPL